MSESMEHLPGPPRFPVVAALLCAACVGAAAWTWMRYSYAWDVDATGLSELSDRYEHGEMPSSEYLCLHGTVASVAGRVRHDSVAVCFWRAPLETTLVWDLVLPNGIRLKAGAEVRLLGRLVARELSAPLGAEEYRHRSFAFDTTTRRLHPASIAGLVVGAMGVFVFAAALRHWLGERRAAG